MGQYEFVFRVRKRSAEGLKRADQRPAMRVSIAGAGAIGRSVASELLAYGHKVLLIENHVGNFEPFDGSRRRLAAGRRVRTPFARRGGDGALRCGHRGHR